MNYPPPDRPVHPISEHTCRRASNHKQQSSNKSELASPPATGNEGKDNRSRDTRRERNRQKPSRPSTSDDRNQDQQSPPTSRAAGKQVSSPASSPAPGPAWPRIERARAERYNFLHPAPKEYNLPIKVAFSRIRDILAEASYNYGDK